MLKPLPLLLFVALSLGGCSSYGQKVEDIEKISGVQATRNAASDRNIRIAFTASLPSPNYHYLGTETAVDYDKRLIVLRPRMYYQGEAGRFTPGTEVEKNIIVTVELESPGRYDVSVSGKPISSIEVD